MLLLTGLCYAVRCRFGRDSCFLTLLGFLLRTMNIPFGYMCPTGLCVVKKKVLLYTVRLVMFYFLLLMKLSGCEELM